MNKITIILVVSVGMCICGCSSSKFSGFIANTKVIHVAGPDGSVRNTPLSFSYWDWAFGGFEEDWGTALGNLSDENTCHVIVISPRTNVQFFENNCAVLSLSRKGKYPGITVSDFAIETGNAIEFGVPSGPISINHKGWYGFGWNWPSSRGGTIHEISFSAKANQCQFISLNLSPDHSEMILLDDEAGLELLRAVQKSRAPTR